MCKYAEDMMREGQVRAVANLWYHVYMRDNVTDLFFTQIAEYVEILVRVLHMSGCHLRVDGTRT